MGGFCLVAEFHWVGSVTNGATLSSFGIDVKGRIFQIQGPHSKDYTGCFPSTSIVQDIVYGIFTFPGLD